MKELCRQLSSSIVIVLLMLFWQPGSYCSTNDGRINSGSTTGFMNEMLKGTDVSALSHDTFLRFQEIKLAGNGCCSNYRFLLFEDGRFFLQENKGNECHLRPNGSKFNRPYSLLPLTVMNAEQMDNIRAALKNNNFEALYELYSPAEKVFDGSVKIMEMRRDNQIQRVVSYNNWCGELEVILQVIWEQLYD